MTLLTEPTRIVLAKTPQPLDADAQAYVNAVEVADGQRIEDPVRFAINNFVIGCKADGIWTAIKASCILAGARTRLGALTPLVGTAPTSFSFVDGDYNRKTGLVGNGTTKYLNSNRNNNADPQNNQHLSVCASTAADGTTMGGGVTQTGASGIGRRSSEATNAAVLRSRSGLVPPTILIDKTDVQWTSGFAGLSRSSPSSFIGRSGGTNSTFTVSSQVPYAQAIFVFGRNNDGVLNDPALSRLSFYSIGESVDLALLDTRVTTLINAFAAAIP
jgi:hypothetical protein